MHEGTEALIDSLAVHGYRVYQTGKGSYAIIDGSRVVGMVEDPDRASEPEPFSWFEKV